MPNQKKLDQDNSYFLTDFFCKISIDGVEFLPQNIITISIKESIFDLIPTLNLSFLDDGTFIERHPLQDGIIIFVQLGSSNQKKSVINMEFVIQDFNVSNLDGDSIRLVQIDLTGIMKNNEMFFPQKCRAFANKSSFDVLKSIATESGFVPEVRTTTSDIMTWRQLNQTNYQMIYETMKRAFKSQDAILTGITRDKKFIITSLQTELKNKSTKKVIYDPLGAISLSNETSKGKKDVIYFNNFSTSNVTGFVNKSIAYGIQYSVYNFDETKTKKITSSPHPLSKFSFKNKDNIGKISLNDGIYFQNNSNMHKNYSDALIQNEFYIKDFFVSCLILYVNPTEKINIFDKLDITFPSFGDNISINQPSSGEYIVSNILHEASKEGFYRMTLVCFRNGLNGSFYQKDTEFKVAK